ncbi:MAG: hypothetical protein K6T78_14965 [Alicyclobacillus sp.]|nr:hypothetical protein [Alicyclobacillus sp.]
MTDQLRWWTTTGFVYRDTAERDVAMTFIEVVEATSRRKVVRRFHGAVPRQTVDGTTVTVHFPRDAGQVKARPKSWSPGRLTHLYWPESRTMIEVVHAPRYACTCGRTLVSDLPYAFMWCPCGRKAQPVPEPPRTVEAEPDTGLVVEWWP